MLRLSIVLFVVALVAFLFGFGIIASTIGGVAKIAFFVFIVLALLSFLGGTFRRTTLT